MRTYIFITGGVLSSLGKGITAGGIGALLEAQGRSVSFLKLDPYLNLDSGTMNPYQHGEVFVTEDGSETDLDLGHYERFSSAQLSKKHCATAGKFYAQLLEKERQGAFLGETVQVVPHFTHEIKEHIYQARGDADITIVEIGGTVGDIESLPFIEAIRQVQLDRKRNRCVFIHVTYVPYIAAAQELKTKPTQHSVKTLLSLGIQPDIIIGRSAQALPDDIKKKIALFTNVDESAIISCPDLKNVYKIPLIFHEQQLDKVLEDYLGLPARKPELTQWEVINDNIEAPQQDVTIAMVGKYVDLRDSYKSITEALTHARIFHRTHINLAWIDAEQVTPQTVGRLLVGCHAILVPGGFGDRGIEGMIEAARYAREHRIPYFGICLGMQIAVIEFARHVLGLADAHSTEFNPTTAHPVVDLMEEQKKRSGMGGTMRLGASSCVLKKNSRAYSVYNKEIIAERHRHRYEFNNKYIKLFEEKGLMASAYNLQGDLPEMIELTDHPFFIGCQFHPEFKSKPCAPHPLFHAFVKAALEQLPLLKSTSLLRIQSPQLEIEEKA